MTSRSDRISGIDSRLAGELACLALIGFVISVGCGERSAPTIDAPTAVATSPDSTDRSGNRRDEADETSPASVKPRSDEDPVAVLFEASRLAPRVNEEFDVSVVFEVAPTFEIHDWHAAPPAFATRLQLELPSAFDETEQWQVPRPVRSATPSGQSVYMGRATFTRTIRVGSDVEPGTYEIGCSIGYQACNARQCLSPVESRLVVTVSVQP